MENELRIVDLHTFCLIITEPEEVTTIFLTAPIKKRNNKYC